MAVGPPSPTPDQRAEFIAGGQAWVRQQRDLYRRAAAPLPDFMNPLAPAHFDPALLDSVRWLRLPVLPNPGTLTATAAHWGIALDFSIMDGITFDDTVLVTRAAAARPDLPALLFHELVHVVQYHVLGVASFVTQYVDGLLKGREYHAVPLEMAAYTAQLRYVVNPGLHFSVEDYVLRTVQLCHP